MLTYFILLCSVIGAVLGSSENDHRFAMNLMYLAANMMSIVFFTVQGNTALLLQQSIFAVISLKYLIQRMMKEKGGGQK